MTQHLIAIAGASGRMGRMLMEAVAAADDCQLAGALDIPASPAIGTDATAYLGQTSGVHITADIRAGLAQAKVLIDFTRPEGTMAHLAVCRERGVAMVIGTTGFSDEQKAEIAQAAKVIPAPDMPEMDFPARVVHLRIENELLQKRLDELDKDT